MAELIRDQIEFWRIDLNFDLSSLQVIDFEISCVCVCVFAGWDCGKLEIQMKGV